MPRVSKDCAPCTCKVRVEKETVTKSMRHTPKRKSAVFGSAPPVTSCCSFMYYPRISDLQYRFLHQRPKKGS